MDFILGVSLDFSYLTRRINFTFPNIHMHVILIRIINVKVFIRKVEAEHKHQDSILISLRCYLHA